MGDTVTRPLFDQQTTDLMRDATAQGMRYYPGEPETVKRALLKPRSVAESYVKTLTNTIPTLFESGYDRTVAKGQPSMSVGETGRQSLTTAQRAYQSLAQLPVQAGLAAAELAKSKGTTSPTIKGMAQGLAATPFEAAGSVVGGITHPKAIVNDPVDFGMNVATVLPTIPGLAGAAKGLATGAVDAAKAGKYGTAALKGAAAIPTAAAEVLGPTENNIVNLPFKGIGAAGKWAGNKWPRLGEYILPVGQRTAEGEAALQALNDTGKVSAPSAREVFEQLQQQSIPDLTEEGVAGLVQEHGFGKPQIRKAVEDLKTLAANNDIEASKARADAILSAREHGPLIRTAQELRKAGEAESSRVTAPLLEQVRNEGATAERLYEQGVPEEFVGSATKAPTDPAMRPTQLRRAEAAGEFNRLQESAPTQTEYVQGQSTPDAPISRRLFDERGGKQIGFVPEAPEPMRLSETPKVTKSGRVLYGDAEAQATRQIQDRPATARQELYDTQTGQTLAATPDLPEGRVATEQDHQHILDFLRQIHEQKPSIGGRVQVRVKLAPPEGIKDPAAHALAERWQSERATALAESVVKGDISPEAAMPIYKYLSHMKKFDVRSGLPKTADVERGLRIHPFMDEGGPAEEMFRDRRYPSRQAKIEQGGYVVSDETLGAEHRAQMNELHSYIATMRSAEQSAQHYANWATKSADLADWATERGQAAAGKVRQLHSDIATYWGTKAAEVEREAADILARGEKRLADVKELRKHAQEFRDLASKFAKVATSKELPAGTMRPVNLSRINPDAIPMVAKIVDGSTAPIEALRKLKETQNWLPREMAEDIEARLAKERPLGWAGMAQGVKSPTLKAILNGAGTLQKVFVSTALYSPLTPHLPVAIANEMANHMFALDATLRHDLGGRFYKHYYQTTVDYLPGFIRDEAGKRVKGADNKSHFEPSRANPDATLRFANGEKITRGELQSRLGGGTYGGTEQIPDWKAANPYRKFDPRYYGKQYLRASDWLGENYAKGPLSDLKMKEAFVKAYLERWLKATLDDAIRLANKEFLDYSQIPYVVRQMSSAITPFFNFSYAAAPRLARLLSEGGAWLNYLNTMRDYADVQRANAEGRKMQDVEMDLPVRFHGQGIYTGKGRWENVSRTSPNSTIFDAPRQAMTNPLGNTALGAGLHQMESIIGPVASIPMTLAEAVNNWDSKEPPKQLKSQRPMWNANADTTDKLLGLGSSLSKAFIVPSGVSRAAEQVIPNLKGEEVINPRTGGKVTLSDAIMNYLLSAGGEERDAGRIRAKMADRAEALKIAAKAALNYAKKNATSDKERAQAVEDYQRKMQEIQDGYNSLYPQTPAYYYHGVRR